MTPDEVKQRILQWDKDAGDIQIISSGATNIVGLAGSFAYRFPISDDGLAIQLYEVELYKKFDNTLSVPTPQFVRAYEKPECIVMTRLEGHHMSMDKLASMPNEGLRHVIHQILQFSLSLNEAVSPEDIRKLEATYIAGHLRDRPWRDYFSHHLERARFPEQPWLEDLARKQYAKWSRMIGSSGLPKIVVHDDLNDQNILFLDHEISGVLDFGDATVGTIAQELRQLLRIGEHAVRMAIDEYATMTGIVINPEEVTTWAITQELAAYCRWSAKGDLTRPSFIRSQANLRRWLDDFQG